LFAGGNVLTSQRLVDVILRAFGVCAASQVKFYSPIDFFRKISL
jgi:N-methylhydantoinase B/oxoprolinase/acetone carboxylase alpha subunit